MKFIFTNSVLCMLFIFVGSIGAAQEHDPGTMVVFSDVSGSQEILKGDYEAAIRKMNAATSENPVFLLNNLCVAYTLSGELENAHRVCREVLRQIDRRRNYGSDWFEQKSAYRIRQQHRSQALAHLNILQSLDTSNLSAKVRVDK